MCVYSGDSDLIASGASDNTLRLWDLRSQRPIDVVMVGDSSPGSIALSGSNKYLACGKWCPLKINLSIVVVVY